MRGESALRPIFPDLPKPTAAATVAFDESRWFTKLQLAGVDRVSQLAVAAADLAMRDAGALGDVDAERIGVYAGCGMGGAAALEAAYRSGSAGRVPPLTIPAFMPNAPASQIAMRQRVQGPVLTYSVACASSAVAIAEAAKAVQRGEVDVAIAGGSEALIVPGRGAGVACDADAGRLPARRRGRRDPALRQRPQRLRARRGRGLPRARIGRARTPARGAQPCAARRLGHRLRCHPPDQARCRAARRARCAPRCDRPACSRATSATAMRTARPRASATWSSATRWPRYGARRWPICA